MAELQNKHVGLLVYPLGDRVTKRERESEQACVPVYVLVVY